MTRIGLLVNGGTTTRSQFAASAARAIQAVWTVVRSDQEQRFSAPRPNHRIH